MKSWFTFFILISGFTNCNSQDQLVKEVQQKLDNNISVNEILTDKKFLPVHAETGFRQLIEKFAVAGILKITTTDEPGKKIRVLGKITNPKGDPVADALVYLYQTDSRGWYSAESPHVGGNEGDMRHARLFGYIKTDKEGKFELQTVKPSGYPQSDLPAHIHVHVWKKGYDNFVNEFLFDDDERLVGEIREASIRNRFMISKPEKTTGNFEQQFSYTITLSK